MTQTPLGQNHSFLNSSPKSPSIMNTTTKSCKNPATNNNSSKNEKRNNNSNNYCSSSSDEEGKDFDFQLHKQKMEEEDAPSKLITQFLNKQKALGDSSPLDIDLEMQEVQHNPNRTPTQNPVSASPTPRHGGRVSFEPSPEIMGADSVRRRHRDSPEGQQQGDDEVVRCSSSARKSCLTKTKTKSRLIDSVDVSERKSGKMQRSGQFFEEEDEAMWDDDIPEDFKKEHLNLWVLFEWISLVLIIGGLVCSLTIPFLTHKKLWDLYLWKWAVMVMVLFCGRLVSSWVVRIIVFFVERNFLLRKRLLYFVYGVRKPVQNSLWLGLVLLAWHFLFDKRVERETNSRVLKVVTKILVCLLVATMIWLIKTLVIKVLASSFHVSTYFDRIQESLFNQFVIETLSGPALIETQRFEEEEERTADEVRKLQCAGATVPQDLRAAAFLSPKAGKVIGSGRLQKSPKIRSSRLSRTSSEKDDDGITIDRLHRLNHKNVSAWNMKRLINTVRYGALSTLDERIKNSNHDDETATQILNENEAKAAAKKIFRNVARDGSKYIYLDDILRFMREEEALKTLNLFEEASESEKISKKALKNWVIYAFRERRALALTLDDTKTAVKTLHHFMNAVVSIIIIVIWLLILGIATSKFFVFMSSQLLLVAFIFGNSCKTVFEAIIFLFVTHPYDVGDRCEIDGVHMIVEEMNILSTVFLRYDNQKIIYPNSVLASKPISNYHRSPDMSDAIEFYIHVATPTETIAALRHRITSYIENVKKDYWYPAPLIVFRDFHDLKQVKIAIWPTHRMNHQDMSERYIRRSHLIEEMVKMFKELDMQYRLLPLEINIQNMPPVTSDRIPATWTAKTIG